MSEANTSNSLPLLAEDALNDAEKKVLEAFRGGWEAGEREVVVHPKGIRTTLGPIGGEPTAEDWQSVILRASFLRSLFLGSYDKFTPRLITISCARIEGKLDLDYCESLFPLSFFWCIFPEGISLQSATVPDLALTKCLIGQVDRHFEFSAPNVKVATDVKLANQFKTFGRVNLIDADIGGELSCVDGNFTKGLNARSSKTGRDVLLSGNFNSDDAVFLVGADIGRHLDCSGGHFKYLYALDLKVGGSVSLCGKFDYSDGGSSMYPCSEFKSTGEVNLSNAVIGGQLYCAHGNFEMGMKAMNLKTGGDVFLGSGYSVDSVGGVDGIFDGKVDLSSADIGGKLSCVGGHFKKDLKACKLKTGGDVLLRTEIKYEVYLPGEGNGSLGPSSEFKSTGEVDLSGANIGGKLSCEGGLFKNGLKIKNLKTGEDVFLSKGFKSNGEVVLFGADISGQLFCIDGHFGKGLEAQNLKTGGSVFLSGGFNSNGEVNLSDADIGKQLDCAGGRFEGGLIVTGLRYQTIELGGDWKKGLAWLRKIEMPEGEFQPYEQLMTVYRRMGYSGWARRIGFELEKKKHEQFSQL